MCWQRGALWEGSSGDRRNLVTLWHLAGAPGTSPLCPLLTPLRAGSSMYGYGDSDGPGFQALGDELVSGREPAHAVLNTAIWRGVLRPLRSPAGPRFGEVRGRGALPPSVLSARPCGGAPHGHRPRVGAATAGHGTYADVGPLPRPQSCASALARSRASPGNLNRIARWSMTARSQVRILLRPKDLRESLV